VEKAKFQVEKEKTHLGKAKIQVEKDFS